jgi:hypothetical protein
MLMHEDAARLAHPRSEYAKAQCRRAYATKDDVLHNAPYDDGFATLDSLRICACQQPSTELHAVGQRAPRARF